MPAATPVVTLDLVAYQEGAVCEPHALVASMTDRSVKESRLL